MNHRGQSIAKNALQAIILLAEQGGELHDVATLVRIWIELARHQFIQRAEPRGERLRRRRGRRTLLIVVVTGGFQYLEATVTMKVQVMPGVLVNPASAVFFTATLLTVLLVYIKEDTLEARKLVYGVVLANAALSLASLMLGWQVTLPGSNEPEQLQQDFLSSAFIPPGTMPGWLGAIAEWNPLSSTVTAVRELFGNPGVGADSWITQHAVLMAVVWPVVLLAIFFPLAVRRYWRLSS